ncbi:MAG: hypothetical protein AAFP15_14810, partial [Bacteroidota bacterium]
LFEAQKAVQIAQALMSTYTAAANALAFPAPPPIPQILAASITVAGLAQVAAIRRTTIGGGGAGARAPSGGASRTNVPDEAVPVGSAGVLDRPGYEQPATEAATATEASGSSAVSSTGAGPREAMRIERRFLGGRVSRGRPYLVGDRKASDPRGAIVPGVTELFVPDESGFVVPGNTLQTAIDAVRSAAPVGGFQPPGPEVARMLGGGASMPAPSVNVTAPSIPAPRVVPMLRGTELVALVEYVQERNTTSFGSYSSGGEG